jgi:peptide/nickel transport system substrate-binding protein
MMVAFTSYESPMQPKHLLEPPAELRGADKKAEREAWIRNHAFHTKPIGTGPFRVVEWKKGDYILIERNPDYWRPGLPYVDRMVFKIIPDAATRAAAMEKGEVDVQGLGAIPYVEVGRLAKLPHLAVTTKGYELLSPIYVSEFNLRRKPFDNVLVRRAVAHALDRKFIVENIWYGFGKVATGTMHSNFAHSFYEPNVMQYPYDPKKAEALLDEAGLKRGPDGIRFKLILDYVPYGEDHQRMAEYIKQALGRVGIAVTIRSQDVAAWLKRLFTDYDFDLTTDFYYTLPDPTLGVQRMYWSKNIRKGVPFANATAYVNPKVDQLFEATQQEVDPAKRNGMFKEIQKILAEDLPILIHFEMQFTTVYNKRVQDLVLSPAGLYDVMDRVWLKP